MKRFLIWQNTSLLSEEAPGWIVVRENKTTYTTLVITQATEFKFREVTSFTNSRTYVIESPLFQDS